MECACIYLFSVEYAFMETGRSSMQTVRVVIDSKIVLFAVKCEFSGCYTVAVTSDKNA
ncbi:MAG: hypothetical protein BWY95_01176 [Bacteroidetes bacterium ADurb.BinA104]|nr:MAG: hypothetical protein BWY95_01176 [Bacteroidetes bacterium ADurb.BinA104]